MEYSRSVIKPGGRLIITDVISTNISGFKELLTLLSVAIKNNFLMDAILRLLKEAGFNPELHPNIGLNKDRYCIVSSVK